MLLKASMSAFLENNFFGNKCFDPFSGQWFFNKILCVVDIKSLITCILIRWFLGLKLYNGNE